MKRILGILRRLFLKFVANKKRNTSIRKDGVIYRINGKQVASYGVVFQLETGRSLYVSINVKPKEGDQLTKQMCDYVSNWSKNETGSHLKKMELVILYCIAQKFTEEEAESIVVDGIEIDNIKMTLFFSFKLLKDNPRVLTYDTHKGIKSLNFANDYQKTEFVKALEPHIKDFIALYEEMCATLQPI